MHEFMIAYKMQGPIPESFRRTKQREEDEATQIHEPKPAGEFDGETTFMYALFDSGLGMV